MNKLMKYRDLLIMVVGVLALVLGWSDAFQEEIISSVVAAVGALAIMQDTIRRAIFGGDDEDEA